jgi:hypothetical protein
MFRKSAQRNPVTGRRRTLACAHGAYNLLSGLWPIVHLRSFERVFGPKADEWLVQTVAGLLVVIGWSQIRGARSAEGQDMARRLGIGTAATLLAIDVIYVPKGRISRMYLLDAAVEAAWLAAWLRAECEPRGSRP